MFSVNNVGMRFGVCAAVVSLVSTSAVHGQVTNFTGLGDGTTWTDSLNWDNGEPSGATYDAVIDGAPLSPFDVVLSTGRVVNTLTIGDEDILRISNAQYLELGTQIDNAGLLRIESTLTSTAIRIESAVSLDGGGTIELVNANARIYDVTGVDDGHLINNDNLIHGRGGIGLDRTQITNHGTIRADVNAAVLDIDPGVGGMVNDGLLEADSGGILRLLSGIYSNTGGTIRAQNGSSVQLASSPTITNGTLESIGTGVIETGNANVTTLTDVTLDGLLRINNSDNIELTGTFTNQAGSELLINASLTATTLRIESDVTLTGGGSVRLANGNSGIYDGIGDPLGHLINQDNLIHGLGQIGVDRTQITNHGTIRADVSGGILIIDPNAGGVTNDSLMEASNQGVLRLEAGAYNNLGGVIRAQADSAVQLFNGPDISNGTLQTVGNGVIESANATTTTLTDVTIDGNLRINNSDNIELTGTIINNPASVILVNATLSTTDLLIETPVTLTGGGTVQLSGGNARITDEAGLADTGHLINVDNLIHGQGSIGVNRTQITNHGTIRADVTGGILEIDPGVAGVTNDSLMEASNQGVLRLWTGDYDNLGGVIRAQADSAVKFYSGPAISNGTLQTVGTGVIESGNATIATLSDITLDGLLRVNNSDNIELTGTITNNPASVIRVNASLSTTDLLIETPVTLIGGGTVQLSGSNARIVDEVGLADTGHLINQNNLIHGQGAIGANRMQITNNGTIRADVDSASLTIDPGAGGLTNTGVMEAVGGGILRLIDGAYNNLNGTVHAADVSLVQLISNPVISDGTLQTSGTGAIETGNGNGGTLTNVTLDGLLRINNAHNLELTGTFTNNPASVLLINSSLSGTSLQIETAVTLAGGGTIQMANSNAYIRDIDGDPFGHLINNDNLIHGQGYIGNNRTQITNHGTIRADVAGAGLVIDPGDGGLINDGVLEARDQGLLHLYDGTFNNTLGTIRAQVDSAVRLTNGPTITDGTLVSVGNGVIETGNGATAILTDVTLDGLLRINNAHNIELTGTFTNNPGSLLLIDSSLSGTSLRIETDVTLTGGGTLQLVNSNAYIRDIGGDPLGHLINNDNLIHGRGYIGIGRTQITNHGTIRADVTGATLNVDTDARGLTNTGSLEAVNEATLYIVDGFANDGVILADLASTVRIDGAVTNNVGGTLAGDGLIQVGNTGALNITNDGEIAPGNSAGELTLNVGTLAFGNTGQFSVELGGLLPGDEYDRLTVLGDVTLDGTLNASLINGYAPAVGDCFDVLITNGTLTGTFSTVNLPAGPGEGFSIYYGSNYVRITVLRLNGDLNGDGYIGLTDLDIVLNNWNQNVTPGDYLAGDPSGDGYVGLDDLDWVLLNWNNGTQFPTPPAVDVSVPEPTTIMLLLAGMIGAVRCKRQ